MTDSSAFQQLALQFLDPMQHDYEAIRPLLFGDTTLSQRSEETAIPSSTLSDYARRFLEHGMDGLRDRRTTPTAGVDHPFPDEVAAHILYLKQVYPTMAYREIVRILERKFGYHTNHHTVKLLLRSWRCLNWMTSNGTKSIRVPMRDARSTQRLRRKARNWCFFQRCWRKKRRKRAMRHPDGSNGAPRAASTEPLSGAPFPRYRFPYVSHVL